VSDNPSNNLFTFDSDWYHNACLNYMNDHMGTYIRGYKRAGDLLVNHVKETHTNQDILVYPIVFLYRQYIELQLKEIIRDGFRLLDINQGIPTHHNIDKLWKHCLGIIKKIWPAQTKEVADIGDYITQFSDIDPGSYAFRYPTNKDGSLPFPNLKYINLRNLSDIMEKISSLLNGVSSSIAVYLDNKIEMELEYRKYYSE
jgi:hypothetical protein